MNRESIELLLQYNKWANTRIIAVLSALPADQLDRNLGNSYGSIRETLAHVLFWEEIWLMRWKGISPNTLPDISEVPGLQAFETRWKDLDRDIQNFFSKMSDENLQEVISYDTMEGEENAYPLWQMMYHLMNHSTYHRGQITTMVRQLGARAASLDFLDYIDQRPANSESARSQVLHNPWS